MKIILKLRKSKKNHICPVNRRKKTYNMLIQEFRVAPFFMFTIYFFCNKVDKLISPFTKFFI